MFPDEVRKKFQYCDNQKILKTVCEALWDAKFALSIVSEVYENHRFFAEWEIVIDHLNEIILFLMVFVYWIFFYGSKKKFRLKVS